MGSSLGPSERTFGARHPAALSYRNVEKGLLGCTLRADPGFAFGVTL